MNKPTKSPINAATKTVKTVKADSDVMKKLKELFQLTIQRQKFLDVTLADGTILRTDDDVLKQGSKVQVVSPDGTVIDAQDGPVTLDSGAEAVIKGGVIESISEAGTPAPDAEAAPEDVAEGTDAAMTDVPAPGETPAAEGQEAPSDDMMAQIINDLADRVAALEAKLSETSGQASELASKVETMSKLPGAPQIQKMKAEPTTWEDHLFSMNQERKNINKERFSMIENDRTGKKSGNAIDNIKKKEIGKSTISEKEKFSKPVVKAKTASQKATDLFGFGAGMTSFKTIGQ